MMKIVSVVLLTSIFGCTNTMLEENDRNKSGVMDLDEDSASMHVESIVPDLLEEEAQEESEHDLESQNQIEQDSNEDNQQFIREDSEEMKSAELNNEDETEKQESDRVTVQSHETATSISTEVPSEIAELLNDNIGIVYQNLITGERIAHNENKFFYAASTVKTIIGMQLVDMNADLNMLVEKTPSDFERGNGFITKEAEFGDKFALQEVIFEMIAKSDNTATQMALRVGRAESFWKYAKHYSDSNGHVRLFDGSNSVTPGYMADALVYLYQYSERYDFIIDYKHQAQDLFDLIDESIPYAKKPGRYGTNYSQIGIVYDSDPYIFVIYVQNGVNQDTMQKISTLIYNMHSN